QLAGPARPGAGGAAPRRGAAAAGRPSEAARDRPQDRERHPRQRLRHPGADRGHPLPAADPALGPDHRDRPGEDRVRGCRDDPEERVDDVLAPDDLARAAPLPCPPPGLRGLPAGPGLPVLRGGPDRPGGGGRAGPEGPGAGLTWRPLITVVALGAWAWAGLRVPGGAGCAAAPGAGPPGPAGHPPAGDTGLAAAQARARLAACPAPGTGGATLSPHGVPANGLPDVPLPCLAG